jgi:hypothetical protein
LTPKSDETGNPGTLPVPELNPLLNPVLNKNLGRWAEVYFTNPPERRDEAVLNLVRELEDEPDTPKSAPRRLPQVRPEKQGLSVRTPKGVTCPECGFENEVHHRFCGECGGPLAASASATSMLSRPLEAQPPPGAGTRIETAPQFGSILHLSDPAMDARDRGSGDTSWHNDALAVGMEEPESPPLRRSYRLYLGVTVALIIAGLAYLAWRGGQFAPARSLVPAPAPPPAVQANSPSPAVQSPLPTQNPTSTAPANASVEKTQNPTTETSAPKPPAPPKDSLAVPTNGSQELATALHFLNGEPRDSAQAAQWLWRAMEKQNTAATVLLAGLYLRGDGVQKSCDQGRVLLDAAADKGNKDAASLLRNLQAFGCQ